MIRQAEHVSRAGVSGWRWIAMEQGGLLKLQLDLLDSLATHIVNVHIHKNEVAADPSLTMETCRQFDCLCPVSL